MRERWSNAYGNEREGGLAAPVLRERDVTRERERRLWKRERGMRLQLQTLVHVYI
jgi:hypothetical protein